MKLNLLSLDRSSIVRKFTILFLLVSILPLILLFYIYFQLYQNQLTELSKEILEDAMIWVVLGIAAGYLALRQLFQVMAETTLSGRRTFEKFLGKGSPDTTKEWNEITLLQETHKSMISRLEEDIRRLELTKRSLHSVFSKVSHGMMVTNTLDSYLQLILDALTEALLSRVGLIFLIDRSTNSLGIRAAFGLSLVTERYRQAAIDPGWLAHFKDERKPKQFTEIPSGLLPIADFLEPPLLCMPLFVKEEMIGAIMISGRKINEPYQDDDQQLIRNVAQQTALAINTEELKYLANIDPLTTLFNYRHLTATLDYEICRIKRYGGNLSVLMIDIDDFKVFNDTFGHPDGDHLLQDLAANMRKAVRATDIVCRYGGDEFAVILTETPLHGALLVAERLKSQINSMSQKRPVSVSIGAADWSSEMTRADLIKKADDGLYEAKQQGKDRIATARDSISS